MDKTWPEDEGFWAAFMALRGVSASPDRTIAELLRSECELDRTIRDLLADAIEGKAKDGCVNFKLVAASSHSRKSRTYHRNLELGIEANRNLQAGEKYERVAESMADEHCVSVKTIEAAMTCAKKRTTWVSDRIAGRPNNTPQDIHRLVLEWSYDEAKTTGGDLDLVLKDFMAHRKS